MTVRFEQLQKIFQTAEGEVEALQDVSFEVLEKSFVSIVGPSGCGKSTSLNILSGLETPTSGKVYLDDVQIVGTTDRIG